ncbi:hypothetical protein CM49_02829 [Paenibacillus sp. P1XP2]|nr:hypothetical protein CM49_02829 [Paenibacillus sp. P1XP2]
MAGFKCLVWMLPGANRSDVTASLPRMSVLTIPAWRCSAAIAPAPIWRDWIASSARASGETLRPARWRLPTAPARICSDPMLSAAIVSPPTEFGASLLAVTLASASFSVVTEADCSWPAPTAPSEICFCSTAWSPKWVFWTEACRKCLDSTLFSAKCSPPTAPWRILAERMLPSASLLAVMAKS